MNQNDVIGPDTLGHVYWVDRTVEISWSAARDFCAANCSFLALLFEDSQYNYLSAENMFEPDMR